MWQIKCFKRVYQSWYCCWTRCSFWWFASSQESVSESKIENMGKKQKLKANYIICIKRIMDFDRRANGHVSPIFWCDLQCSKLYRSWWWAVLIRLAGVSVVSSCIKSSVRPEPCYLPVRSDVRVSDVVEVFVNSIQQPEQEFLGIVLGVPLELERAPGHHVLPCKGQTSHVS